MLPAVEFALNNASHASTGFTSFYVNSLTHPRVQLTLPLRVSGLDGEAFVDKLADTSPTTMQQQVSVHLATRFSVTCVIQWKMNTIKKQTDAKG